MPTHLVRGFMPSPSLLASLQNACSRLADAVNGSEHDRYIAVAMEGEPTTYISLKMLHWAVLVNPEPMPTRLVRGSMPSLWPSLFASLRMHAAALLMRSAARMTATWH